MKKLIIGSLVVMLILGCFGIISVRGSGGGENCKNYSTGCCSAITNEPCQDCGHGRCGHMHGLAQFHNSTQQNPQAYNYCKWWSTSKTCKRVSVPCCKRRGCLLRWLDEEHLTYECYWNPKWSFSTKKGCVKS